MNRRKTPRLDRQWNRALMWCVTVSVICCACECIRSLFTHACVCVCVCVAAVVVFVQYDIHILCFYAWIAASQNSIYIKSVLKISQHLENVSILLPDLQFTALDLFDFLIWPVSCLPSLRTVSIFSPKKKCQRSWMISKNEGKRTRILRLNFFSFSTPFWFIFYWNFFFIRNYRAHDRVLSNGFNFNALNLVRTIFVVELTSTP